MKADTDPVRDRLWPGRSIYVLYSGTNGYGEMSIAGVNSHGMVTWIWLCTHYEETACRFIVTDRADLLTDKEGTNQTEQCQATSWLVLCSQQSGPI